MLAISTPVPTSRASTIAAIVNQLVLPLVDSGAALMFRESELDGARLAAELRALARDPDRLRKMEKAAGLLGRPEAAKELADVCVKMMSSRWGREGRVRATAKEVSK